MRTFLCWNKTVVQYRLRLTELWNVLWNYCNSMHFLRKCYIWMYWIHDIILCALLRDADLWLAKNPALQNFFQTDISACPIVHVANKYFSVLPYQNLLKWNDLQRSLWKYWYHPKEVFFTNLSQLILNYESKEIVFLCRQTLVCQRKLILLSNLGPITFFHYINWNGQ